MNTRRKFLKNAGFSVAAAFVGNLLTGSTWAASQARRPNIVWLISEDNSVHYSNMYNKGGVDMPNVNRLADNGVIFDHAFSNCPVCSAARTTLITGCYGNRIGTHYHRRYKKVDLPNGLKMMPAYLQDAGYYTSYLKKTDFNCSGDDVWDSKKSWTGRQKNQPFFHQHQFATTHESKLQSAGKTGIDKEDVALPPYFPNTAVFRKTINTYHELHRKMDKELGKVVDQLEKEGVLEDTFIFYFGDHGGVAPRSKGYLYETGLHVPMVMRIPKNFKHLVDLKAGTRFDGFVNFIDFAPTTLNLAGLKVPEEMDGKPFIGPGVDMKKVAEQDEAFGIADRFDEKYDMVRSLRKANFKYIRSYQPFNPDGLHNNYRYLMVAYSQWRDMYKAGKLNDVQSQFFEPRSAEALYDIKSDPYETKNLADDPKYASMLKDMRNRLASKIKSLPDLSFYPESYLSDKAFADPAKFGQKHKDDIAGLVDTADLSLLPFKNAKARIDKALNSNNKWKRYWALIVCSCFGKDAKTFSVKAKDIAANDSDPLNRVRAAEFLALIEEADPAPVLMDVLAKSNHPLVALLTLNSVVMLKDGKPGYKFNITANSIKANNSLVDRRIKYLSG